MADTLHVGIFHLGGGEAFAEALEEALQRRIGSIQTELVGIEPFRIRGSFKFDWAIVTLSKAALPHLPTMPIAALLKGAISRRGALLVTDFVPTPEFKFPAPATSLEGWNGDPRDRRVREIADLITRRPAATEPLPDDRVGQGVEPSSDVRLEAAKAQNVLVVGEDGELSFNPALFLDVYALPFLDRTKAVFRAENIVFVGDVIQKTEAEWLRTPNFGRKSLRDSNAVLGDYGLAIGSEIPGWPPPDIESLSARARAALGAIDMRQAPLGTTFVPRADFLVIDSAGDQSDYEASAKPAVQQLHSEIVRKAAQFASVAARLDNQVGWQGISGLCKRLVELLDRSTDAIPDVIGSLYSTALELGSFFEMDRAIQRGEASYGLSLDAEVRRPLEDLIRSLAPWLRSFPSVREMDDEAGQFLIPPSLLEPSAAVIETADQTQLIGRDDAALLMGLLDAARRGDFQGAKAGRRGHRSASNMIIAVAGLMGGLMLGDYATKSVLIGKAGTFLAEAEAAIVEVVADLPPDIRSLIEVLIRESRSPYLPAAAPRTVTIGNRSSGRRPDDGERIDVGGTLIGVGGSWYVRFEGGNGAAVPLLGSIFATSRLDKSRTYAVFGRLITSDGQATGFYVNEVIVDATGKA